MARQVQQMFPTYPISVIIADLQVSRSMEVTIDNILEGRVQVPAAFQFDDDSEFGEGNGGAGANVDAAAANSMVGVGNAGLVDAVVQSTFANADGDYLSSTNSSSSSLDSGYEIERNSNIFGNQNELLRDER